MSCSTTKKLITLRLSFLCIWMLFALGCSNISEVDPRAERMKIQKLLQLERKYHVEKMTEEFVNMQSKNFISVNRGVISRPTKAEGLERFGAYFSAVDFEAWDDISPPHITFSTDYSMAYAVIHKSVIVTFKNTKGEMKRESTEFAWLAVYKKYDGEWMLDAIASTNKPGTSEYY